MLLFAAAESKLPVIDIVVLVIYLAGVVGLGFYFMRKSSSTEEFTAAGRSLPGWAVGLSIFGTYVSSISFLANPGKSYSADWNPFVFSLSLPLAAWIAVKWFVPFYREGGVVSAYAHLEHRFGLWARTYALICYLLTQLARMGTIMYLVAMALHPLTGWDVRSIILLTGVLVTLYTLMGGIEAVIWTDVVQSIVLTGGMLISAAVLLFSMPEGPGQLFAIAAENHKFSLGSFDYSLQSFSESTFWVVLIYGLAINVNNFGIDQSYVQRYITAKSDGDAQRSVWMGALLYLPISAVLFFVGTGLFAYYSTKPQLMNGVKVMVAEQALESEQSNLSAVEYEARVTEIAAGYNDSDVGDKVFPHFIVHELPVGLTGLLIAAVLAAAMSSVDSSLNGSATLFLIDVYKRFFRPNAGERESMIVLYTTTLLWGAAGTGMALAIIGVESALDAWWKMSGIFTGGMLGLFLLGFISRKARNPAAITGVILGTLVIFWATLSTITPEMLEEYADYPSFQQAMLSAVNWIEPYKSFLHSNMIPVVGTLSILFVGLIAAQFGSSKESN